ncbi:hypothetical protein ACKFKG_30035 [Phormidesmis sp. 146-35]
MQLFGAMYSIVVALTQLQELVDDTCLAVGSEAYATALQMYNYARARGQGGGLNAVVGEMRQRFARKPRKAKAQEGTVKVEGTTA